MNAREAYKALLDGKKLTRSDWGGDCLEMDEVGNIVTCAGSQWHISLLAFGWEIYEEPKKPRTLYRRPVYLNPCYKEVVPHWKLDTEWFHTKEGFMEIYGKSEKFGQWETMDEPEECEE